MKSLDKLQDEFANKSRKFWAERRTELSLLSRAECSDEKEYYKLRKELSDVLDSGILTYPQTIAQAGLNGKPGPGITNGMPYRIKKAVLGIKPYQAMHTENEKKLVQTLAYKAMRIRKANWSWRIGEEAEEKQKLGWHPFFVTLTVDPKRTDPETLWREGREFRKYIRKLANVVCDELGHEHCHKPPYRPESDYVTYAGVIEHGKSQEHHHGHFVIWLRSIPSSWRADPNAGRRAEYCTKNECVPMRELWKWSGYDPITREFLSPALYFRSVGDIWERKYNFVLPLNKKTGEAQKVGVPRVAGAYITKYLTKEHKQWHHRMKATRNLGMNRLKEVIRNLEPSIVEALSWRAETSSLNLSLMQIHSAPIGLVKQEAQLRHYCNQFKQNRLAFQDVLTSNSGIFIRMLKSVQDGARPDRMHSLEFFDWVGRLLPEQKGYCKQRQIAAHVALQKHYPPEKRVKQHVKLGGNDIGHSSSL